MKKFLASLVAAMILMTSFTACSSQANQEVTQETTMVVETEVEEIFIIEETYDIDSVEKFAVDYAKFLYEHRIDGDHRINIINRFPEYKFEEFHELYDEDICLGFFSLCFGSDKKIIYTSSLIYDGEKRTRNEYSVEDYFAKNK